MPNVSREGFNGPEDDVEKHLTCLLGVKICNLKCGRSAGACASASECAGAGAGATSW